MNLLGKAIASIAMTALLLGTGFGSFRFGVAEERANPRPITAIIVEHCRNTVAYLIFDGEEPIMITDDSSDDDIRGFLSAAKLSRFKNHILEVPCEVPPEGVNTLHVGYRYSVRSHS